MRTIENNAITWVNTERAYETMGMPANALVSSNREEERIWRQAINQMLSWKTNPTLFEEDDKPDDDIWKTAIDFAVDQSEDTNGAPAPCSIIPSGSGRIAMEWNDGPWTIVIEFVALGQASCMEILNGKLNQKYMLDRSPVSRKMERRG